MKLASFVAVAIVMSCASAALSDDVGKDSIDGVWSPSSAQLGGKPLSEEVRESIKLEVKGDDYTVTVGTMPDRGKCKLDPSAKPKALDITGTEGLNKGKTILAIHERDGDTPRVCYELGGKNRPTEFKTTTGSRLFLVEYKLQKTISI